MDSVRSHPAGTSIISDHVLSERVSAGQMENTSLRHSTPEPATKEHTSIDISSLQEQLKMISGQLSSLQNSKNFSDKTLKVQGYQTEDNLSLSVKILEYEVNKLKEQIDKEQDDSIKSILIRYITGKGSKDRYALGIIIFLLLTGVYGQIPISEAFDIAKRFIWA